MSESRPIDAFWAGFLGATPTALVDPGICVVPHAALAGYSGVWFFVRAGSCVVSAPAHWCERLEAALAEATVDSVLSPDGFAAVFGDAFDSAVGPSYLGWLEPGSFQPIANENVRPVTSRDAAALAALREASGADWEAVDLQPTGLFGWFEGEELLAAASMTEWAPHVVGPGVLSRRSGCGRAVVSAVVDQALRDGSLVVYQTLMENTPAVAIAQRLGFEQYASHIAVRLTK